MSSNLPWNDNNDLRVFGNEYVTTPTLNRTSLRLYENDAYLESLVNAGGLSATILDQITSLSALVVSMSATTDLMDCIYSNVQSVIAFGTNPGTTTQSYTTIGETTYTYATSGLYGDVGEIVPTDVREICILCTAESAGYDFYTSIGFISTAYSGEIFTIQNDYSTISGMVGQSQLVNVPISNDTTSFNIRIKNADVAPKTAEYTIKGVKQFKK